MRNDWESLPTVEGVIVQAWIGQDGMPDVMHVQGIDVAEDIGNLDRIIGDEDNPDPNRPFSLIGKAGTIAQHGYTDADRLIGKRCLLYSGGCIDSAAIEPEQGDHWGLVVWCGYINM